jgi:hypothetical protein
VATAAVQRNARLCANGEKAAWQSRSTYPAPRYARWRMHLRHCERSEAIQLFAQAALDCFVASLLAMTDVKNRSRGA